MTNPTPGERWEQGIDHDPRSEEIIRAMADLDWKFYDGVLDIRCGGDGDNGESMMFLLDYYFAEKDARTDPPIRLSPTQRKILSDANPGPLRTDWDGWTVGQKGAIRALIRKGLAREVCWRLSATEAGVAALREIG